MKKNKSAYIVMHTAKKLKNVSGGGILTICTSMKKAKKWAKYYMQFYHEPRECTITKVTARWAKQFLTYREGKGKNRRMRIKKVSIKEVSV